jgi:hypothetical protein
MDPNADQAKQESEKQAQAEQAAQEYYKQTQTAESTFSEKIKGIFSSKNLAKTAVLGALEMAPVFAGYSAADLWVAGEGIMDVVQGLQNKDYARVLKGGVKLGAAAVPGLPVSELSPSLDELLPNKEPQTSEQPKATNPI